MTTVCLETVLQAEILPSLPAVAVKVLSLDPEIAAGDLARLIAQDAPLSARILKAANSPLYAPASPVGNIKRAIILLGNRQVRTLSLAFSLVPLQNARLDFTRFWQHSLATAVGTRRLLKLMSPRQVEEGFTAGLLADVGAILLAGAQGERYAEVLGRREAVASLDEAERAVFGFDHSALGLAAARRWRFPEALLAVIEHHRDPRGFTGSGELSLLVRAVHLAGLLAEFLHGDQPERFKGGFERAAGEIPALKEISFDQIAQEVAEDAREIATWMGIHLPPERSVAELLEEANKKLVAISSEYEEVIEWIYRTQVDLIRRPEK